MNLSQAFVLFCVAAGSLVTGWTGNERFSADQRAEMVEKHIQSVESEAADWATQMARYEQDIESVRQAVCGRPFLRLNLAYYERNDDLPRVCGQ